MGLRKIDEIKAMKLIDSFMAILFDEHFSGFAFNRL